MSTWADEARVLELTGVSVTFEQLAQAQGVLDIFVGVTYEALENLTARDVRLLGQALAYQAAWMARQIDVFTRTDVSDVDQDGVSFTPANEDALVLAPLARRCIKRLSWLRPGSVRVTPFSPALAGFGPYEALGAGFLRDVGVGAGEADWDWRPL